MKDFIYKCRITYYYELYVSFRGVFMDGQSRERLADLLEAAGEAIKCLATAASLVTVEQCQIVLQQADHLCQQQAASAKKTFYGEIFSGLRAALPALGQSALNAAERQEIAGLCQTLVQRVASELAKEADGKKEILFLPYKAAMWDCLESIWQAAMDDKEHCKVYVVPIPYADRNPDHSPAAWHYEGSQFPKYVPITSYQEYDISTHHPDVIYIHNPYDDWNLVTSVDAHFYSDKLKQWTNELIYVPYFVCGDTMDSALCRYPGITNADHVIVQSESIKKVYEDHYPEGNPPEGKFLALGSPKFDKLYASRREDFILPVKWRRLIKGKKVVLYNLSMQSFMENKDTAIEKITRVLSLFKKQKHIVVWWRPHPLLRATLRATAPALYLAYDALETEYRNTGWGIYDGTADLYRAIAWSDIFYGDRGSLAWLYKATGKPVMIQDLAMARIVTEK